MSSLFPEVLATFATLSWARANIGFVTIGWNTDRAHVEPAVVDFVKRQTPGAKYVMSACTGAEILAAADVLNGKRATVTKSNLLRIAVSFWSCLCWYKY